MQQGRPSGRPFSVESYGIERSLLNAEHFQITAYDVEGEIAGVRRISRGIGEVVCEVPRGFIHLRRQRGIGRKLQNDVSGGERSRDGLRGRQARAEVELP